MSPDKPSPRRLDLSVPVLTRVEGEGSLHLIIRGGQIEKLRLSIFEAPRLFEKFLEGRSYEELPDLVARICGICPVAYQMSAVTAVESLFCVDVGAWVSDMRRLLYCGEWIQSHCLHIHLLAAPDFFGYRDAISMARDLPQVVRRGMRLQGLGNALIQLLGGRSVHPVGVRVGGFHRAPDRVEAANLLKQLQAARTEAEALLSWTLQVGLPERDQDFLSMACLATGQYPLISHHLGLSDGRTIADSDFEDHLAEHQEPDSTALFSLFDGQPYLVGPLARFNLAGQRLPKSITDVLDHHGLSRPSSNPFHSFVIRAAEVVFALQEAIRILENYQVPPQPWVPVRPRAGTGYGCSEAPRGMLWHRYEIDRKGIIRKARIVPPTSQNQARIEADLQLSLQAFGLQHDDEAIRLHCEQVIRNYDPCISCATHFLKLTTERL